SKKGGVNAFCKVFETAHVPRLPVTITCRATVAPNRTGFSAAQQSSGQKSSLPAALLILSFLYYALYISPLFTGNVLEPLDLPRGRLLELRIPDDQAVDLLLRRRAAVVLVDHVLERRAHILDTFLLYII